METLKFDRHKVMSQQTLNDILDLIKSVRYSIDEDTFKIENMLYGFYDGYDYSDRILSLVDELGLRLPKYKETIEKIDHICKTIKSYPKL